MIKGIIEIKRVRMAIARLEMGKPVKRTPKRAGGMHGLIGSQLEADKPTSKEFNDAFNRFFELSITSARVPICGCIDAGGFVHHLAPSQPKGADRIVP